MEIISIDLFLGIKSAYNDSGRTLRRLLNFKKAFTLAIFAMLITEAFNASAAPSASTTVGNAASWSTASWTTSGGGTAPTTNGGTFAESVTVGGLGTGDTMYVDISLTISSLTMNATGTGSILYVKAGQTLHITGDLTSTHNNVHFYVDAGASLIVDGTLTGATNNLFGGSGTISGGTMDLGNNAGCISGTCPTINFSSCSAGGTFCSDHNISCVTNNTISASSTSICSGNAVTFTGSVPTISSGTLSYTWESSTTSSTSGFSTAAGTSNTQNYTSAALSTTTWFRRYASNGSCGIYSSVIQVTVTSTGTPSVSISATSTSICSGTSITLTATPTYGGTSPSYQWKKNGTNVTTGTTYTSSTWSNGDQVTCVMTSNYTCISGSSTPTSNTVTITVGSSGNWIGGTSTDWNTASNWCGGVPTSLTNVTVSSGTTYSPAITASGAVCNNLTVNSGATLTITSPGTLSAKGAIVNNGTISGTGTMTLNGVLAQTISGNGSFGNLTLNNILGCTVSSATTITGILTLTSGTLASGGNVTLDLSTGAIAGSGSGSISGNLNVKKSVSSTGYHYLAAPLSGVIPSQFADDVYLYAMYSYNEALVTSDSMQGWSSVTNFGSSMTQENGYALYLTTTGNMTLTGTYSHSASYSSTFTHTNTNAGNLNTGGWNLFGNPYPSAIDWSASSGWTKTGMDNSIYFWNPSSQTYGSYVGGLGTNGATQYIPSMQAVFVHVSSTGTGTLALTNSVRVTSNNPSLWKKSAVENILRLKVSDGNYSDETIIRLSDDATNSFDGDHDAYKMFNESDAPDLYTHAGGTDYSINSLSGSDSMIIVPLKLKVNSDGKCTFTANDISSIVDYDVILEDRLSNVSQDLKLQPNYSCQVNGGDTSSRFFVNFKRTALKTGSVDNSLPLTISGVQQAVNIKFPDNSTKATIVISNTMGEKIFYSENVDVSSGQYSVMFPSIEQGIYVVKVITSDRMESGKVILGQ